MKRIPEPELMSEEAQAQAYASADFSEPNSLFLEQLVTRFPQLAGSGTALDLGCGPADIPAQFVRRHPGWVMDAVDGSEAMLQFARATLDAQPGAKKRIHLLCEQLPSPRLTHKSYDAILSNSLLHHLHDPGVLWHTVRHCAKPGAPVLVMDLARPESPAAVDQLVEAYASDAPPVLRRDFRASLYAAFREDEIRAQLREAGLSHFAVEGVSDRHLVVFGSIRR
jgi:SAM-dependent methyltransferase